MKFTGNLRAPRIDLAKYRAVLDKYLKDKLGQAIEAWLEATVIAEVPVWSGASRATFVQLANHIRYTVPITPVAPSREGQGIAQSVGKLDAGETKDGLDAEVRLGIVAMAVDFQVEGMVEPVFEPFPGVAIPGRRSLFGHARSMIGMEGRGRGIPARITCP